ncbi:ankyrin repeat domain-containing protein [Candidatus Babela massiliensis]|uniref:Ankyrin repeats containing protein n=1 Tax=Candidatus Babela massiliensis TaxID=673862 RepID=V6DFN6_9BACT|nr:ankyrin repeat domain-containing protein [Candidatus Babela massiliensis]CDK30407.1 Ankyrin repeats containing protein [Candidatus Babela massiliensis]
MTKKLNFIFIIFLIGVSNRLISNPTQTVDVQDNNQSILEYFSDEILINIFTKFVGININCWNEIYKFDQESKKVELIRAIKNLKLVCRKFNLLLDSKEFIQEVKSLKNERFWYLVSILKNNNTLTEDELDSKILELWKKCDSSPNPTWSDWWNGKSPETDNEEALKLIFIKKNKSARIFALISLTFAYLYKHKNVIKILSDVGYHLNMTFGVDNVVLLFLYFSSDRYANIWIKEGTNVNFQGVDGKTALMRASYKNYQKTVHLLIEREAEVNAQDHHGVTALMMAVDAGHKDIVKTLIQSGADPDIKDDYGNTALNYLTNSKLSEAEQLEIESMLINRVVEDPVVDNSGSCILS